LSKLLINNAGGVARPRLRKMAFGSCSGDNYSCRSDYTTEGLLGLIITCIFRPGREYRTPCADDEEIRQYVCVRTSCEGVVFEMSSPTIYLRATTIARAIYVLGNLPRTFLKHLFCNFRTDWLDIVELEWAIHNKHNNQPDSQ
jgi:hypothetical protein